MIRFNLKLRQDKNFQDRIVNDFDNLKKEFAKEYKQKFLNDDHHKIASKNAARSTMKNVNNDNHMNIDEGK